MPGKQNDKFHCPCCQPIVKEFSTKAGMLVHVKTIHPNRYQEVQELFGERPENHFPCSFCGNMLYGNAKRHERNCDQNPNCEQRPTYKRLLEEFLEKIGRWATTIGWESKTINESTWKAYKGFIRRIVSHSEARNPGHLINFDSVEFSQLVNIDRYVTSQENLTIPQEQQLINAYLKLVNFIRSELDSKIDILGNKVPHLIEIKRYINNCFEKASFRLKEVKKKIPLDKENRNWEKKTMGGAKGCYTELDFETCDKIFSRYLSSRRRKQVLQWFEDFGFTPNTELGISNDRDMRLFIAADLFFHGVGARIGAVINLTYEELRRNLDHGDFVELRCHTFKTAGTFGNSPITYPKREFKILVSYAEAFPLRRTGGQRNTEGLVFADIEGRPISNHRQLMRQIQMCVPDVQLGSHTLCPQDYRHYVATLTLRHADERLIRAAARSATHSVQMHQRYQHSEVAAADYQEILDLVNKPEKKKRKRIIVPSSSSSSSSEEQQQQQPPNPQQQPQEQPPNPQQQLAAQLVAHMRRTGHLQEPAGNAAAVSAVVESAAGSSSSSSSEEPMPPPDFEDDFEPPQLEVRSKPFTIGNPNPNACTVTVPGQFLGDYYDCVACNLEEVCLLCIERCHAECPIKSHQGFGFYRCQCGGQGVPICKNLLPLLNKSISSNE